MAISDAKDPATFDPEERVLCRDDTCTGIIGADGRCGTCGLSFDARAQIELQPVDMEGVDPDDRVPCSDDCCVGIIGANGRCGTCGKPYGG